MESTNPSSTTPAQDERIMAALAHVTALLPMMGVIVPILIWITQKEKSKYVAFQAIQAAAFQLFMVLGWFLGMGCYMGSFIATFAGMALSNGFGRSTDQGMFMFFPFLVFGLILLAGAVCVIYGAAAAIMTLRGKDFRYVVLGRKLEQFLQK